MSAPAPTALNEFRLRRHALPAFGPSLLYGFSQGAILPVIVHSAMTMGATTAQAGGIFALLSIGALLSNIPAGQVIARIGERRAIMLAAAATAIGLTACFLANTVVVFAVGVFLTGIASSVFILARQTFLTDLVPAGHRGRAMSLLGGTKRIGAFIGPFAAASVIAIWESAAAYLLALVAIVGAGVIAATAKDSAPHPPTTPDSTTIRSIVRTHRRTFATVGIGVLLLSATRQARQLVVPLWAGYLHIDAAHTALIVGLSTGVEALVFYPAGIVTDRWQRRSVAATCCLILAATVALIPLAGTAAWLTVVALALGFGNGIGSGIVNTIGADLSPAIGRPVFFGIWAEIADIGSALGPMLLSLVAAVSTATIGIGAIGAVGAVGGVMLWKWVPRRPPMGEEEHATTVDEPSPETSR